MKNNLALKFIAIFLCACALFAVVGSTVGVVSFVRLGIYSNTLEHLQNQQMSRDLEALANRIAVEYCMKQKGGIEAFHNYYLTQYDEQYDIQRPEEGMWYYVIIDYSTNKPLESGPGTQNITSSALLYQEYQVSRPKYPEIVDIVTGETTTPDPDLLENPEGEQPQEPEVPEDGRYEYEWFNEKTGKYETYYLRDVNAEAIYKVQLYMLPGAYEQKVAFKWQMMEIAHTHRYHLFIALVLGLAVMAVCVTYLCSTAGKRQGGERTGPKALNKVPLDMYLAVTALTVWILTTTYIQVVKKYFVRESAQLIVTCIGLTGLLACVLTVGFFFACVAQMKQPGGYWWRHSFLAHTLRLLWRALCSLVRLLKVCYTSFRKTWRKFVELLPLTWQWILWVAAMCGILVLAVLSQNLWIILAALLLVAAFFFYALHAYKILLDGTKRMSQGNLDTQIDKSQLMAGFAEFATHLNALADVAVVAAQKQMRSERMRAELITNVSHDIKTPLTSIISYVDLLQKAKDRAEAEQYLDVLSRQSLRMKKLIDDLIELSKASTGNMPVDLQEADAAEYLNQAIGEFSDKLEKVPLTAIFESPAEEVRMRCDPRLTWRVISNLFSNAVKYALPGTRLYIDLVSRDGLVMISMKNISKEQLNVSSEELMERFVRGDTSRNTEGSGLGLNIAKSLMELQKGRLELTVDGDLFKATMVFPAVTEENETARS